MEEIAVVLLSVLVHQTGRWVVWAISFGRWRGEPWLGNEGRIHGLAGALSFVRDGKRVVTETGLFFVGIVFWVLFVVLAIALAANA